MKEVYKDYLFEKHILISEGMSEEKHVFETLFAMAHFFGVKITKGRELVHYGMVKELSKKFGENVPEPFYRGFPQSVRNLSAEELLLISFYITLIRMNWVISTRQCILYLRKILNVQLFEKILMHRNL